MMNDIVRRALESERNALRMRIADVAVKEMVLRRMDSDPKLEGWQVTAIVRIIGEYVAIARELGQVDVLLDGER